jgi:hypothetical protein
VQNLISGGHRTDIFRPQGWISPVLLVDGRLTGSGRTSVTGGGLRYG